MNGKKLLMSKWTAVKPKNKEKHFLLTEVSQDDQGKITQCLLVAIHSGNEYPLAPEQLKNRQLWQPGWQQAKPLAR